MKPSRHNLLIGAVIIVAAGSLLNALQDRRPAGAGGACCAVFPDPSSLLLAAEPSTPVVVSDTPAADGFFPEWAGNAKFYQSVRVRDTESAVGRLSAQPKEISLKDLARMHGHLCDGLVISFVELKAVLYRLFPDGVVDRTDLRVVSKNGPCWVDTACWLTGARINFQTLRVDASVGDGFIVQKISTGAAWEVRLKPGVFPEPQAVLENHIREQRAAGQAVDPAEVDRFEAMANELIRRLLNTPPDELLVVTPRPDYRFQFNDLYGGRGDIINRDLGQSPSTSK
ncbi:MAG: formylmethanofuran dehydrogenase subunit E family protein [Akkermansiaceae bacterium]|nr:formylmethanofuran dehydrogenase subunit E family protein [Akkermansiaceae bacterium]